MFTDEDIRAMERGSARIDATRKRIKSVLGMVIGFATKTGWASAYCTWWNEKLCFFAHEGDEEKSYFWMNRDGLWHLELWNNGTRSRDHFTPDHPILNGQVLMFESTLPALVSLIAKKWRIEECISFFCEVGREVAS